MSRPAAVPASSASDVQAQAGPAVDAGPGYLDPAARRRAQWALFAAGFATFSLLYCVQPLLPLFTDAFRVTPTQSSLALSLSTGTLSLSIFLVGLWSQALPRKGLMAASLLGSALLVIAAALASGWHTLLVLRALLGVVLGGVPAVAMAYLAEELDPRTLGAAMGLYIGGSAFGGLSGRVITGAVSDVLDWRHAMGVVGVTGLLAALLFIWLLPASRRFVPRRGNGLAAVREGLSRHLRHPPLMGLFAVGCLLMGAFVTVYNYMGFRLLQPPFSLSQTFIGAIFVVYLVGIAASTLFGRLADHHGRGPMLTLGTLLALGGLLLTLSGNLAVIVAGLVVFTFGFFAAHSVASGWVGQLARGYKAQAASLYLLAYYLGSSVLGSLGGQSWSAGGWVGVTELCGGLVVVALGISVWVGRGVASSDPAGAAAPQQQ